MEEIKKKLAETINHDRLSAIDFLDKLNPRLQLLMRCLTGLLEQNVYICNVSKGEEVSELLDKM
jgi:hypothetical protein